MSDSVRQSNCVQQSNSPTATRGTAVTQADRLGDTAVNTVGTTTRYNRFNRCAYDALAAVATGAVLLDGDKGDGSPRATRATTLTTALTSSSQTTPTASTSRTFRPGAGAAGLGSSRCVGKPSCRTALGYAERWYLWYIKWFVGSPREPRLYGRAWAIYGRICANCPGNSECLPV